MGMPFAFSAQLSQKSQVRVQLLSSHTWDLRLDSLEVSFLIWVVRDVRDGFQGPGEL